jgi:spermidine synthase
MLLEVVLLFAFQALHGSLYAEVSLIVTAFMAGLALGGAVGNRIVTIGNLPFRGCCRLPSPNGTTARPGQIIALKGVLAGMAIFSALLPVLFSVSPQSGGVPRLAFSLLALIGGVLGGMIFPLASASRAEDGSSPQKKGAASTVGGTLYAADLAGGCLGALSGTALLIPILGIPQTCAAIALLAIAALIALL